MRLLKEKFQFEDGQKRAFPKLKATSSREPLN
jgi:hypothetical protein